jgi:hypothetical protein
MVSRKADLLVKVGALVALAALYQLQDDYTRLNRSSALNQPASVIFAQELSQHGDEAQTMAAAHGAVPKKLRTPARPPVATTPAAATQIDPSLIAKARAFVQERKEVYDDLGLGVNWHLRGIAHLSVHWDMIVAGQVRYPTATTGQVVLYNVHSRALEDATQVRDDCHRLDVWVRVRGPEIMAGSAKAIQPEDEKEHCYWVFDFDLRVAGDYVVESKVLLWDGDIAHDGSNKCQVEKGNVSDAILEAYPVRAGFRGFKLYNPQDTCCEVCARQKDPPCRYWLSPPSKLVDASFFVNGCEFFFDADVKEEDLPFQSALLGDLTNRSFVGFNKALGIKHWNPPGRRKLVEDSENDPTSWDPFLVSLDDSSYLDEESLANDYLDRMDDAQGRYHSPRRRLASPVQSLHAFPHNAPTSYFLGCGWQQMFALDFPCVSGELDDKVILAQESFTYESESPPKVASDRLPLCTPTDELTHNSKGRWVKEPWPNSTECPQPFKIDPAYKDRFKISAHDPERPRCWHRDDLSTIGYQCGEMNCQFIYPGSHWESTFREKEWMGVWRQYGCDYYDYTDAQLQQCFNAKKVAEVKFDGRSVADSFKQNVLLRLQNIQLYNGTEDDAISVTLSTLSFLHLTTKTDSEIRQSFAKMKNLNNTREVWYVANGFYLASEREIHCHMARMRQLNHMVEDVMLSKGYNILSAFDVSQAVSYETAGQFDGMHLMGPAMKTVTVKLFHHLCHDVITGTLL